jgi:acyl dehydratase
MKFVQFNSPIDSPEQILLEGLLITPEMLREYAWASGDYNPIHYNEERAKAMGLPGIIAHGMLSLGFMNRALEEWCRKAAPGLRLENFDAKFVSMVSVGDRVSVTARLQQNSSASLDVQLYLYKNGEREAVACTATAQLVGDT